MTPSFYKELRKHFLQIEEKAFASKGDVSSIEYYTIGVLNVKTPEKEFSIEIAYTEEKEKISYAAMSKLIDDSYVMIFHIDTLTDALNSINMHILTICAHEVGHYLAEHLDNDVTNKKVLNYKPEDQLFLMSEYARLQTDAAHTSYMNSVLYSLLKGGCNILELEADLIALKFVHVNDLAATHLATMDEKNIFARMEKINRIKQLNKIVNETMIETKGYGLELILTRKDGQEDKFSCGSF